MNANLMVNTNELAHWFNAIRQIPDTKRTKFLDAFWDAQLESKCWLINKLNQCVYGQSNIYIFGGWIGVLANLLFQGSTFPIGKIRSIDLDPECETIADNINKLHEMADWRFKAVTGDMSTYNYQSDITPDIVINTSTEHITQQVYDQWYNNIPDDTLIVAQGNNYFECAEHIRCSSDLEDFKKQNHVKSHTYAGEYKTDLYTRYMCIWIK